MRLLLQTTILGGCIGAFVGISASAVAGTVIAALIASATLALSVLGRYAKSSDRADLPLARQIDLEPLMLFALVVLIAAVAASALRSKIVRVHSDDEIVRALSAPPDVEKIIDSWVAIGRDAGEDTIDTVASEGESTGGDPSGERRMDGVTGGVFSRKEIATWLLGRRTSSNRPAAETTAELPIPLSTTWSASLADTCDQRRSCEEGEGEEDCLRENFFTIKYKGSEEFSGMANILEGKDSEGKDLLDESNRNIILYDLMELLCR